MKVYAAWHKEKNIRKNSTSGGVFSAISQYVLKKGGYVCGVVVNYDEETPNVKHVLTKNPDVVKLMRGSKYVQSDMTGICCEVIKCLKQGEIVLFSGTPCQVDAVKSLAKAKGIQDKLITVDVLCHGVSSPKVFEEYCMHQQEIYRQKITEIKFRYKKPGWIIFSMYEKFSDDTVYIKDKFTDPYLLGFLNDMYARRSCEQCPYTSLERYGDFTLADFWGYKSESYRMRNNEKGISAVLVNSRIGQEIWERINSNLVYEEHPVIDIIGANRSFQMPWVRNKNSEHFFILWKQKGWAESSAKYCRPEKLPLKARINFWVYQYWYLIPVFVKKMYRKTKNKF